MDRFESISQLQRAFDTLGVSRHAALPEVRRAYRLLVRRWHPDRFANEPLEQHRALEMLKGINEAYEQILAALAQEKNDSADRSWTYTTPTVVPPQPTESGRESRKHEPAASPSSVQIDTVFFASFISKKNLLYVAVVIAFIAAGIVALDYIAYRNELKKAFFDNNANPVENAGGVMSYGGSLPEYHAGEPLPAQSSQTPNGPSPPYAPGVPAPSRPVVPVAPVVPSAPIAAPAR